MNYLLPIEELSKLRTLSYQCLLDLSTDEGINASSRNEAFGCIFGRDSAITVLKLLNVHIKRSHPELLEICKRALKTLVNLQGRQFNIESGEEPGKFIHEFRRDNYEHLVSRNKPWYVYEDGILRNYDSIDSTPLSVIAIYKYWQITGDTQFLLESLPSVEAGLNWIITYGDRDKDMFLEYELPTKRMHGGLPVQSWTDSYDSVLHADGTFPSYPIAAVEVQAVAWLALRLWSDFYLKENESFGRKLFSQAQAMKKRFNKEFLFKDGSLYFAAQALDGKKQPIKTVTANPLLCLWSAYKNGNTIESIVDSKFIDDFVVRAFQPDMFDEDAGIRTMSSLSPTFNPTASSYHNGSFWPVLNGLVHEGLETWGYKEEAEKLLHASLKPIFHFKSPIELYMKDDKGTYLEYTSPIGKKGCRYQAWTAAAALDWLTQY